MEENNQIETEVVENQETETSEVVVEQAVEVETVEATEVKEEKKQKKSRRRKIETVEPVESEWKEQVVQIRRVTKVVKGGKKLSFSVGLGDLAVAQAYLLVEVIVAEAVGEGVVVPFWMTFIL